MGTVYVYFHTTMIKLSGCKDRLCGLQRLKYVLSTLLQKSFLTTDLKLQLKTEINGLDKKQYSTVPIGNLYTFDIKLQIRQKSKDEKV